MIKSSWKMLNESEQEFKVQFGYFRNMFDLDYNIGFGCPVTGSCQKL